MGLLRLLLAISVLLDHAHGLAGYSMIGGPLAVQCFYIISGFYMGLVLNERYTSPALNRTFWINRGLRIYGVYYAILALYLFVFALIHWQSGSSPLSPYFSDDLPWGEKLGLGLLNVTVIGQDLPIWLKIDHGGLAWTSQFTSSGGGEVFHFMLIPAAWSLSLELMFYAVAPFIARRGAMQIAAIAGVMLALRAAAAIAGFGADPFSYRFFPFELTLFLAGVLGYKAWAAKPARWLSPGASVLAISAPAAILAWPVWAPTPVSDAFFAPHRLALLALVAAALPAVHAASQRRRGDRIIGELSYPFYLCHLLVLGLVSGIPQLAGHQNVTALVAIGATIALSWLIVQVIDAPIEELRRKIAVGSGCEGN